MFNNLELKDRPLQFGIEVSPEINIAIARARNELAGRAEHDSDGCCGYFPGFQNDYINNNLPASKRVEDLLPVIEINGLELGFNFLRLSLGPQPRLDSWHLDTDTSTAISGNYQQLKNKRIWRALLNLNVIDHRVVEYLDIEPNELELSERDGYVSYNLNNLDDKFGKKIILPKRSGLIITGVLFDASKVLHRGNDRSSGHFVAGYGYEEAV